MNIRTSIFVESFVIVAIFIILVSFLTPVVLQAIDRARTARVITDIRAIRRAALAFYVDTETLPCTKSGGPGRDPGFVQPIVPSNCWPDEGGCRPGCVDIPGWNGPYLDKWPRSSPWHRLVGSGKYNWNRWVNYTVPGTSTNCFLAGVVTLEVCGVVPLKSLQKIDSILDDGDLSGGFIYTEGPRDKPERLYCVVICR